MAASEAIYRLLQNKYELHFADADVMSIPALIPKQNVHAIPFANDQNFVQVIANICKDFDIDVFVPAVDEEILKACELEKTNPLLKIMVPDAEYSRLMLDKLVSMNRLADKGIPVPKTLPLIDAAKIGFPCIAKPRNGRGSRGFLN